MTRIRSTPTSPFLLEHHSQANRKRQPTLKLPRYEPSPSQKFQRSREHLGGFAAALLWVYTMTLAFVLWRLAGG